MKNLAVVTLLCTLSVFTLKGQQKQLPDELKIYVTDQDQRSNYKSRLSTYPPTYLVRILTTTQKFLSAYPNAEVKRNLGNNYYIIRCKDEVSSKTIKENVDDLWMVNHLWKLSPQLLKSSTKNSKKRQTFYLKVDTSTKLPISTPYLGKSIYESDNHIMYKLQSTMRLVIDQFLPLNNISYIGIENNDGKTESRVLDLNLNPNTFNLLHHVYPALNGQGMVLSMQELAFDPTDIDIINRTIPSPLAANDIGDHATDMATVAAGAGNSFINGKGVAWSAMLTSSGFEEILPDRDEDYTLYNAWVQNHSYGTTIESFYGAKAMAFDLSANNNPSLLHVFSIGNQGNAVAENGKYKGISGYANITGNFKMSKNSLAVGAVDTTANTVSFVSNGPAFDGRIKPEIVAYSTSGSSSSAAMVSGLATIIHQQYHGINGSFPNSSLVKALIINSANDVYTIGPDFRTGYGSVDAYRTVKNLIANQFWDDEVAPNETKSFALNIPSDAENLKVTVVWNDPAAQANANVALVNDIDMRLSHDGQSWLPWVLNTAASETMLAKEAVRGEDHLNNVEQISLRNPEAGLYTISVSGYDVGKGNQAFSIAYQWDTKDTLLWTFPTASDFMPYDGETGSYFRWKSTLSENEGSLQLSFDKGESWEIIAENVDLSTGFFRWSPNTIQGIAKARLQVGSRQYETDLFSVSPTNQLSVGFNCEDSVLLQWNSVNQAVSYDVFTSDPEMKFQTKIVTTTDTAMVLRKSAYPGQQFAVQAKSASGTKFLKSPLINYELVGNSCYLQTFFVSVDPEVGNTLFLGIGSTYNIKELTFERKEDNKFVAMNTFSTNLKTNTEYVDSSPLQGLNTYRARLKLENGQVITSNEVNVYFLTSLPYLLFPNPVKNNQPLTIISGPAENGLVTINITNQSGRLVVSKTIEDEIAQIQTINLSPGLYFYKIAYDGGTISGKFVVI